MDPDDGNALVNRLSMVAANEVYEAATDEREDYLRLERLAQEIQRRVVEVGCDFLGQKR